MTRVLQGDQQLAIGSCPPGSSIGVRVGRSLVSVRRESGEDCLLNG
jgi:hypothetical protein